MKLDARFAPVAWLGGILALALCVVAPPARAEQPPRPRLVVLVVVDQLPTRLLDAVRPLVREGLARLTSPDAARAVARYAHANTYTATGHATLSTGASPRVHGIVANWWWNGHEVVYGGRIRYLMAEPLADVVVESGGRVAALSLKDRGATLLAGHKASVRSWYDPATLHMTGPSWLPGRAETDRRRAEVWTPLHPEAYAKRGADDRKEEQDFYGLGRTFPHGPALKLQPAAFLATPGAGSLLTDAAIAAVDQLALGRGPRPDLLTVSYSHIDFIGHAFTPESWESFDAMLRLDIDLGRLFAHLDVRVGRGAWTVLLTSDHGARPAPKLWVDPGSLMRRVNKAIAAAGLVTKVRYVKPYLCLEDALRAHPAKRSKAIAALVAAAKATEGVATAVPTDEPGSADPYLDPVREGFYLSRACAVHVIPKPHAGLREGHHDPGGTAHGTPYDVDTLVPLLGYGAAIAAGAIGEVVDVRQVAPTLAKLLGVRAPAQGKMPPIGAMLR